MKRLFFLLSLFVLTSTYAQRGGGQGGQRMGGGQRPGQQEQQSMPEFDAAKVAGIFSYNDTEAVKKMKLKNDKDIELKVVRVIAKYNMRMDELTLLNTENFDTLNVFVNTVAKHTRPNRNQNRGDNQIGMNQRRNNEVSGQRGERNEDDPLRNAMELSKEKIRHVKKQVETEEELLNNKLESILSEKQFKKWLKYQKKIKKKMEPEQPSNNQNQGGMNARQGQQGGRPAGGQGRF